MSLERRVDFPTEGKPIMTTRASVEGLDGNTQFGSHVLTTALQDVKSRSFRSLLVWLEKLGSELG